VIFGFQIVGLDKRRPNFTFSILILELVLGQLGRPTLTPAVDQLFEFVLEETLAYLKEFFKTGSRSLKAMLHFRGVTSLPTKVSPLYAVGTNWRCGQLAPV